jgi:hypothetical protein
MVLWSFIGLGCSAANHVGGELVYLRKPAPAIPAGMFQGHAEFHPTALAGLAGDQATAA